MNQELADVQAGFRKGRGTRDQIINIRWIIEKQENSRKTFALLTTPRHLHASQQTVENSERGGNTRPPHLPPEKTCMQVKKQQLELDLENRLVPNQERSSSRLYIVTMLI